MNRLRNTVAGLVLGCGLTAAWFVGGSLVKDVQFARAEQQVQASRQQISNVQDMAAVFKAIGKAVEPSVVSIDVKKTVHMHRMNDDNIRKFFFRGQNPNGDDQNNQNNNGDDNDQNNNDQNNGDENNQGGGNGFQFQTPDMPEQFEQMGTGSGVIMEVDGDTAYIVTNNHVAGGATEMTINLWDGRELHDAKLVGADPKSDIAVVKVQADHLIPAKWGDSDKLEKGDIICAFGSPFGYVGSMTHGIVSALNRHANIISGQFAYENFIQVDAPINPGNSGGPLVNLEGEVVGINTAIATRSGGFQGIGFAIPSDQAKYVYDQLKGKGKVVRGWLGVAIKDVSKSPDEATSLGWTEHDGIIVEQMMNNTPASGKLQAGDIITDLNGSKVANVDQLRSEIARTTPGTDVKLTVMRDKKQQDVTVKLGEQPDDYHGIAMNQNRNQNDNAQSSAEALGVRVSAPSAELTQKYGLDDGVEGAVITGIKPGSLAQLSGLRPGDVITKVDATPVKSADDLNDALSKKDLAKGVKLYVTDREGSRFFFLKSGDQ
ncbi:MAG TPA: trypsin-like peptidase domain-containing protein [Tepidisphaeraceae bacterium]